MKRTIAIGNSNATTAGAITFNNLTISQTSILQLDGTANGTAYSGAETVTFTNGIVQTAASDTLVLDASPALGTTQKVFSTGASTTLVDGIAPVWIVTNEGNASGAGPYDFVTYDSADGYVQESGAATTLSASTRLERRRTRRPAPLRAAVSPLMRSTPMVTRSRSARTR